MIILIMPEKSQQTRGTQNALESEWERTLKHYKQSRSLGYCKHWAEYFWGEKIVIHVLLGAVWLFILDIMQVALVILCLGVGFFFLFLFLKKKWPKAPILTKGFGAPSWTWTGLMGWHSRCSSRQPVWIHGAWSEASPLLSFSGGSVSKWSAHNAEDRLQCRRPGFYPRVRKTPWRRKWQLTPVFLPGKSHGQRSLVGYSLWGHKSRT